MYAKPKIQLSRVLDALGDTFLEVVAGDVRTAGHVAGFDIFDPVEETQVSPRAVVFAVGVRQASEVNELLYKVGRWDATALVVRAPVPVTPQTERAVRKSGVALLGLTRGASWARLAAMLRTLLAEVETGNEPSGTTAGLPSGDLFALANAVAALIDAPVTIEDKNLNVLAFSGRQDEADSSRFETILGRKVPEHLAAGLERSGVLHELYASKGVVMVDADAVGADVISKPRVAVAVRAGDDVLGSIWGVVDGPLTDDRATALRDAAKIVSLHMLRLRAAGDVERRLRQDLVARALEAGPTGPEALSKLGLLGRQIVVVALGVLGHDPEAGSQSSSIALRQRLSDACELHLAAVAPGAVVALLGDVTYCLLPVTGAPDLASHRVARLMSTFVSRTASRLPAVAAVGPVAADPGRLTRSRAGADRALRVLLQGRGSRRVATTSDVIVDALLLDLADMVAARGDQLEGAVSRLKEHDAKHNSQLLHSLRCWLQTFGDVTSAADRAFVHPNTFRYRLRKLSEIGQIDLTSDDDRFAAMLQLRLMGE
ncbi:helix-turn-helix domain-containing protein [Nocardioides panacihumi]|uniref:Helix-turn-helix domain-containing protein n=1 Tax=Nocardioides panacihumi TaxID=400774 RepID=A0ABN2RV41_9ACTN